jgi:hypothetical protein
MCDNAITPIIQIILSIKAGHALKRTSQQIVCASSPCLVSLACLNHAVVRACLLDYVLLLRPANMICSKHHQVPVRVQVKDLTYITT